MSKLELIFTKCIQDSQEYGSNNEHMVSRVFFLVDGKEYQCNLRQPYGESFSYEKDPIEVDPPEGLEDVVNYGQFRDEVEKYYRSLVGNNGGMIHIEGSVNNIRMMNNTFVQTYNTEIDKAGLPGAW